jgi:hypothetical protein
MKTSKQGAGDQQRSRQEIEDCVTFVRLELYNRGRFCGPKAVQERMKELYHVSPCPVRERLHAYCHAAV